MRPSLPRKITLLALAASLVAAVGCTSINDLLGTGGGSTRKVLTLQSISLRSDQPANPADPTGPATISSNGSVRFSAIGTFLVGGTLTLQTNDVSAGVVWTSSNPELALPGADGRVVAHGSAGTASITATSPALGTIPAITSNSITLTIQ